MQTLKEGLKKCKVGSLETRISKFLLRYRITPHSSLGSSPSELMWGRTLRSKLDLLRPDVDKRAQEATDRQRLAHDSRAPDREFAVNDTVYARNYGSGPRWVPGSIVSCQGTAMYVVKLSDNRELVRHVDQLRPRLCSGDSETSAETDAEDTWVPGGATTTLTEPEAEEVCPTSEEASIAQPDMPDADTSRVEPSVVVPDSQSEQLTDPPVRRSTRVKQPPDRYRGQFNWCLIVVLSVCNFEREDCNVFTCMYMYDVIMCNHHYIRACDLLIVVCACDHDPCLVLVCMSSRFLYFSII